jgi:thermitase
MPDTQTPVMDPTIFDPSDGTKPVTLPTDDPCCISPCDPPWMRGPACLYFNETRALILPLTKGEAVEDFGRAKLTITVTYGHRLCLIGKQHGGLAYTFTLLPGETMTLFQSDRFRRTTSETTRYSVQTTFAQFVSGVYQKQQSGDVSVLQETLNSQSQSAGGSVGASVNLFGLVSIGGGGGGSIASSSSSANYLSAETSASQFLSVAQQASQYTNLQRSVTVSSYEDSESVSTTKRTFVNPNKCYAVNYFVRTVLDVYTLTTTVTAVTLQVTVGEYVSPILTPAQITQLPAQYRAAAKAGLAQAGAEAGGVARHAQTLTVPTDGLVYDPELAHCCVRDPELEQAGRIGLERAQAEAQKLGLEVQLMALEVQRRQALLAAGTLAPFEPAPTTTVVA